MRILLTICMLGFIAFGFSACGNDDDRVVLVRSETQDAFDRARIANTKLPKAPNGKSWGEWLAKKAKGGLGLSLYRPSGEKAHERFMEVRKEYSKEDDRWTIFDNGISPKGCDKGEVPLLWIDTKTGDVHLSPSKLSGSGFCSALRKSYVTDKGNGDVVFNYEKAAAAAEKAVKEAVEDAIKDFW